MPTITIVGAEARARLKQQSKGFDERAPYREAIANLEDDQLVEVAPEGDETLRQVKARARRAAREVLRDIRYGETEQGTLLIWIAEPATRARRTGRRAYGKRSNAEGVPV